MIKNQFYSTLRRQQRKINKLLVSEPFQKLLNGKTNEISTDELYKLIKEEKVDYDDIKGIYKQALTHISADKFEEYKQQAIDEVKNEKESEVINSRMNRRSYRLSKKKKDDEEEKYDVTQVGCLALFKTLRLFRKDRKDDLPGLLSQAS